MATQLQPIPASGLTVPRANVLMADVGSSEFIDIGDCESFSLSLEVEEIERYGKNFSTKTLRKSDVIQVNASISFEVVDFTKFMRALTVGADENGRYTQDAATDETVTFSNVSAGKVYKLPHMSISSISIDDGLGVDYLEGTNVVVLGESGYIQVLTTPETAGSDLVVTYSAPAVAASDDRILAGVGSNFDIRKSVHVISINKIGARDLLVLHDVQLRPESERQFVGEDDYASLTLTGKVFADVSKAEGMQLGYLTEIA